MTDKEIDILLQQIIKLSKEDAPGQVNDAIYRLNIVDGLDFFNAIAGIAILGHKELGRKTTIKQAVAMLDAGVSIK